MIHIFLSLLAVLFFLLAILFFTKSPFIQRYFSRLGFAPDDKAAYILFGTTMLFGAINLVVFQLPAPYRAAGLVTSFLFALLLFALFLYMIKHRIP